MSVTLLGISGSLRSGSLNSAVIETAAELCVEPVRMEVYRGLGSLPYFNADLEMAGPPPLAMELRERIAAADAVMFSCPEYAHGMSGVLKNALEWVVGGCEIVDKPVAVVTASTSMTGGDRAQAWLIETLLVIGAKILPDPLAVAGASKKIADGRVTDEATLKELTELVGTMMRAVGAARSEEGAGSEF